MKWKGKTVIPLRPCFSFRICLLGDMLLLRDCLGCILQYIRILSVHFNSSTFLWLPASPPEYGMANYTNITCNFDEMMKRYINIKNNSNLHLHQTLNKRIGLMKREHGCNPTYHFSFGERFDETLMKIYFIISQRIRLPNHQFIWFSSLVKSVVETVAPSRLYAHVQTCNHAGTTARNIMQGWQKEKGNQCPLTSPPTPPQFFGKQKAIAH